MEKLYDQNGAELGAWMQAQKSAPGTQTGGGQTKPVTASGATGTQALPAEQVVVATWDTLLTASKPGCETVTQPLKGQRMAYLPAGTTADALPSAEFTVHVYGVVHDSKGKPVGGVAVSLPGGKAAATTKADGSYYLPFKVAGRQPPTGKPEAREQVNLTIKQLFAVVPEELAFSPGKPQVSVFSIENRADTQDITIQGLQVLGAPADAVVVRIRGGDRVVHGDQGTRCVIGPGGFCNVEVRWDCPVGATNARIKVIPEDSSLGSKAVLLRTGLTAKQIIGNHQAKVVALLQAQKTIAVLQALKTIAAKPTTPPPATPPPVTPPPVTPPPATPPPATPPPLPALDSNWLDTWRQENDAKIKQIEDILLKTAAENLPEVKAAPKPGVPETVDTTKAPNVFNFFGGQNHVNIFAPGTKATFSSSPEKLGTQGSLEAAKNQQKAGQEKATSVGIGIDQGSAYSGDLGKQDPVRGYFEQLEDNSFDEGFDAGRKAGTTAVNKAKKFAGAVLGTVEGVATEAANTYWNFFTKSCSIISWNTKYEVRHDAASGTTTVTVFEDSVEIQSFTGDRSQKTLYAGQRVSVGPQGFGTLEELRADQLAAAADLYAPAFLGLNPVTYEQSGVEQAVLAAEGEGPAKAGPTGLTSPLVNIAIWAVVGLGALLVLGKLVFASRRS
ncbi:MAG TPA: hypothetical protein VNE39_10970 [Planctomycetota bacterium]|nr:hypothetical protein [Planctomycetota bacterium]